jgi:phage-related minor tail protein
MLGLVGERGAEAIIPLDRLGSMGSTYNISVTAGMGADGKDIGTQIVNALKRYERTNGALPLTVA